MIQFKYFDKPELYTGFLEKETCCDICNNERLCFDASLFLGKEDLTVICPECLAGGKLYGRDVFTCDGDIKALKEQLKQFFPALSEADILQLAEEKTNELEKTTPFLITWQDLTWPCDGGDYCRFIGYGSKAFYNERANGDGKLLFISSLQGEVEDLDHAKEIWENVPASRINNYEESNEHEVLFYVFQSLQSEKIITLWDCL